MANAPALHWNAHRISWAVALVQGHRLYAGPHDGAITEIMYGPGTAIAYAPAALAGAPTTAVFAGALLTLVWFYAPVAWLLARGNGGPGARALAFAVFCLASFQLGSLRESGSLIHADAPALGLGACACACALSRRRGMPLLAALLAVLAAWTKQTLAPLVLALPLYLWIARGAREALRSAGLLAAAGALVSACFLAVFGPGDLFFNAIEVPRRVGWKSDHLGSRWIAAGSSARSLAAELGVPLLLLGIAAASRGRPASWRGFARDHPWTLLLLVAMVELPLAIAGEAKIGGAANAHSVTTYFAVAAAALALAETGGRARLALAATAATLLALSLSPSPVARTEDALARFSDWRGGPLERAVAFARAHPGEAYFPVTGLVHLYADGAVYHDYLGILDRDLAGLATTQKQVRAHVPPGTRYVVFPRQQPAPPYLRGFHRPIAVDGLSGYWNVFVEGGEPPRTRPPRKPAGAGGIGGHEPGSEPGGGT